MTHDLRVGLRSLLRSPGFLVTAIGSLAIAIGATVAAFSVIDAVRLRALPFIDADRLARLAAIGIALGVPVALFATRFIGSLLYATNPRDPVVYGAVVLCIAAVSLVAAYIPARRAGRVDPIIALRAGDQ